MRVLVTGATGFVGMHTVRRFIQQGHEVVVLVRRTSSKEKIDGLKKLGAKICFGDIRNKNSLRKLPKNVDKVCHLAALLNHSISEFRPFYETNVFGTKNLMDYCLKNNVEHFIFTSSIAVYGVSKDRVVNENSACNPSTPYGISKYKAEKLLFQSSSDLTITILRPPTVYGPGGGGGVLEMARYVKQKLENNRPLIYIGRHGVSLSLCYIDNLIQALVQAARKEINGVFLIDDGRHYTEREVLRAIWRVLNSEPIEMSIPKPIFHMIALSGELTRRVLGFNLGVSMKNLSEHVSLVYDSTKAQKDLQYHPKQNFSTFIKRTVRWYEQVGLL